MKRTALLLVLLLPAYFVSAQDDWDFGDDDKTEKKAVISKAFNDTRVVNGHSVETLEKGVLDLRISHRFGDLAVPNANRTAFGLDNSTDIRIAFEYGISDKLMVGVGRSKGSGPLSQLWDGLLKYKIAEQSEKMPFSISANFGAFVTAMQASSDSTSATSFGEFAHRVSYFTQVNFAHSFKDIASIQISPGFLHRNYVAFGDDNSNFVVGIMGKVKMYKKLSLVGEYYYVNRSNGGIVQTNEYVDPLSFGIEIKTFAHVFQINYINSPGIGEAQFLPYTNKKWSKGEFRLGFTISRHF